LQHASSSGVMQNYMAVTKIPGAMALENRGPCYLHAVSLSLTV